MPDYPQRLLPQKHFEIIEPLNSKDVLCRWSQYPVKDELGKLSALAIEEKRLPSYSTNKIPPSQERDILIAFYDKEIQKIKWVPGEDPLLISEDEFYYDDKREYFFIQIESIDGYRGKFPYHYSLNQSDYKFIFEVKVKHDPLKINYTHCVFEIYYFDGNGNPANKPSHKSLEKVVITSIRDELIRKAKFSSSDFQ